MEKAKRQSEELPCAHNVTCEEKSLYFIHARTKCPSSEVPLLIAFMPQWFYPWLARTFKPLRKDRSE